MEEQRNWNLPLAKNIRRYFDEILERQSHQISLDNEIHGIVFLINGGINLIQEDADWHRYEIDAQLTIRNSDEIIAILRSCGYTVLVHQQKSAMWVPVSITFVNA